MNEPAPAQILVVSDDAAAYLAQAEVLWSTEWPAIQLVRSEQLLFGAADTTQVLVRDAATVPECALASLPGVDILPARDLGQARELAQRVLARSHSADVSADSVAHHCETFEAGEFVQRALAPLEMERVTRHPVQSDSEDFPLHSAVDAHMPGAGTARNRRASSPVVVILNAVGGAGASTLAWAAAAFYESTRGSAAIVDGDDRKIGRAHV